MKKKIAVTFVCCLVGSGIWWSYQSRSGKPTGKEWPSKSQAVSDFPMHRAGDAEGDSKPVAVPAPLQLGELDPQLIPKDAHIRPLLPRFKKYEGTRFGLSESAVEAIEEQEK